jgi:hypothetical protein
MQFHCTRLLVCRVTCSSALVHLHYRKLTSINDNITTGHPGGVPLRAHENSKISNLLRFGESTDQLQSKGPSAKYIPVERCHILPLSCVCQRPLVGVGSGHLSSDVSRISPLPLVKRLDVPWRDTVDGDPVTSPFTRQTLSISFVARYSFGDIP